MFHQSVLNPLCIIWSETAGLLQLQRNTRIIGEVQQSQRCLIANVSAAVPGNHFSWVRLLLHQKHPTLQADSLGYRLLNVSQVYVHLFSITLKFPFVHFFHVFPELQALQLREGLLLQASGYGAFADTI